MNKRVNGREFLNRVSVRTGLPLEVVDAVYGGMLDEIRHILYQQDRLLLSGFGSFYVHRHKGHPVQFGDEKNYVPDYLVARFSASNVLNKYLREDHSDTEGVRKRKRPRKAEKHAATKQTVVRK